MDENGLVDLSLGLIQEGRFVKEANEALLDLQGQLMEHSIKYGERAAKSSVELQMKVKLVLQADGTTCAIISGMKKIPPALLAIATLATTVNEPDGGRRIMVRPEGSSYDHPDQKTLEFTGPTAPTGPREHGATEQQSQIG